jgi:hypothetical protein
MPRGNSGQQFDQEEEDGLGVVGISRLCSMHKKQTG